MSEKFKKWFLDSEQELLNLFYDLLRFPSISADSTFRLDLQACSKWIINQVQAMGFDVQVWKNSEEDAPVIFASYMKAGPDKPVLLIYNHYDVQPVDPLELWQSDPFEPKKEGDQIFARGAQDNKGQLFYVLAALQQTLRNTGSLPINIKLCIEGEEESGSQLLTELIPDKTKELQADYLLVCDLGMPNAETPAITLGMRGIAAWSIEVQGATSDLHSGFVGGMLYNPLHALVEILAKLRDPSGHIAVPGFYESMQIASSEDLSSLTCDFDATKFFNEYGCEPTGGEKSFSPLQRAWLRPTLEINGVHGGYGGPGTKTVIPACAIAKLTARLVLGQDPEDIGHKVKNFIESLAPKGVTVTCHIEEGKGLPLRTSPDSVIIKTLAKSTESVYKKAPQFILEGASIPITALLQKAAGAEVALFGLGLPSDKIHAPNERFNWNRVEKGFYILCDLFERLGTCRQDPGALQ